MIPPIEKPTNTTLPWVEGEEEEEEDEEEEVEEEEEVVDDDVGLG